MGIEVNDFLSLSDTFLDLPPTDQPPGSPKLVEFPENLKLTPYFPVVVCVALGAHRADAQRTPCFTTGGIADTTTS